MFNYQKNPIRFKLKTKAFKTYVEQVFEVEQNAIFLRRRNRNNRKMDHNLKFRFSEENTRIRSDRFIGTILLFGMILLLL